jgi:hypothetical protein
MNFFRRKTVTFDSPLDPNRAREVILKGKPPAPENLVVKGNLNLSESKTLTALPAGLKAESLDLHGCTALRSLPAGLRLRRLDLSGCAALESLPPGLDCYELVMRDAAIRTLPPDLRVAYRLDLSGCTELESLPDGLRVGTLILSGCVSLQKLPEGLDVCFLDISGCTALREWPHSARLGVGRLRMAGCAQFTSLPPWLAGLAQLDVSGCAGLSELPAGLRVSSWVDIVGTGIRSLPDSLRGVGLRWRGVPVDERIAFRPETITAREALAERNAELRRVMIERMGYENFLREADAEVLDRDRDPGGERRLLRVRLEGDEDLVCVAVICPSTARQYLLRVPPTMRTCRQAVAWVAGFDNPNDYRPLAET